MCVGAPLRNRVYRLLFFFFTLNLSLNSFGHGVSEADKHAMLEGGLLEYMFLGAKHMVTGYDHLLFIFGVIFFLTKFSEIVKFITAFTIGHCITLIFATFMGITANAYLVDAVIALTVIYKGFDNIDGFRKYLKMSPPNMSVLVFVFGLIHGFGLSTRLQELPLNHDELLMEILAFNVGVEVGQVAALSVMMLFLAGWRKTSSFAKFSFVSNVALMLAGLCLLGMQLHGYSHDHGHHDDEHHVEKKYEDDASKPMDLPKEDVHGHGDGESAHDDDDHGHSHEKPTSEPKRKNHSHEHGDHTHGH